MDKVSFNRFNWIKKTAEKSLFVIRKSYTQAYKILHAKEDGEKKKREEVTVTIFSF